MIKLLISLSVIVLCAINHIEGSDINEALRAYYDSGAQHNFKDEWRKYRQAFENEIAANLQENFGVSAVNIYEADKHESYLIAKGFQLTDGVVSVFFEEMVLRELPNLVRPKIEMDLPDNFVRIKSKVGRMFVDTAYYTARNASTIIYAHPEDQKNMSPFSLQQVDSLGKLVIVAEDCTLSGLSIATLSGDSVTLGTSPFRLYDCKFMVEISAPDSGSPPVIAPYFPGGPKETLEMIMSKPLREEMHTKLQGALYSYINSSVLFGSQSTDFRNTQQTLFKSYHDFVTNYIARLNQRTINKINALMSLPFYEVTVETESSSDKKRRNCHMEIRNTTVYGVDTAYATRAGGPFNDGSIKTAADEIVFSSMQIRGEISHDDEKLSSLYDFAAELRDVSVTIVIDIEKGSTKLQQIHFMGWRSLEYSMIPRQTDYKARHEHESFVYGYLLNELPVHVINHLTSILGDGKQPDDNGSGGGGNGSGGGGEGEGGGGDNGGGSGGEQSENVPNSEENIPYSKKDKKKKGFLSDHFLDEHFFSDDVLDKDFLDKDFLEKDIIDKGVTDNENVGGQGKTSAGTAAKGAEVTAEVTDTGVTDHEGKTKVAGKTAKGEGVTAEVTDTGVTAEVTDHEGKSKVAGKAAGVTAEVTDTGVTAEVTDHEGKSKVAGKAAGVTAEVTDTGVTAEVTDHEGKSKVAGKAAGVTAEVTDTGVTAEVTDHEGKSKVAGKAAGVTAEVTDTGVTAEVTDHEGKNKVAGKAAGVTAEVTDTGVTAEVTDHEGTTNVAGKAAGVTAEVTDTGVTAEVTDREGKNKKKGMSSVNRKPGFLSDNFLDRDFLSDDKIEVTDTGVTDNEGKFRAAAKTAKGAGVTAEVTDTGVTDQEGKSKVAGKAAGVTAEVTDTGVTAEVTDHEGTSKVAGKAAAVTAEVTDTGVADEVTDREDTSKVAGKAAAVTAEVTDTGVAAEVTDTGVIGREGKRVKKGLNSVNRKPGFLSDNFLKKDFLSDDKIEVTDAGVTAEVTDTGVNAQVTDTGVTAEVAEKGVTAEVTDTGVNAQVTDTGVTAEVAEKGVTAEVTDTGVNAQVTDTGVTAEVTVEVTAEVTGVTDNEGIKDNGKPGFFSDNFLEKDFFSDENFGTGVTAEVTDTGINAEVTGTGVTAEVTDKDVTAEDPDNGVTAEVTDTGVNAEVTDTGVTAEVKDQGVTAEVTDAGVNAEVADRGVTAEVTDHEGTKKKDGMDNVNGKPGFLSDNFLEKDFLSDDKMEVTDTGVTGEVPDKGVTDEVNDAGVTGEVNDAGVTGEVNDAGVTGEVNDAGVTGEDPDKGVTAEVTDNESKKKKDYKNFFSDDFLDKDFLDKDFFSDAPLSKLSNAAKPFFDNKFFSDRRSKGNGPRRHVANATNTAHAHGLGNDKVINIDNPKQEKVRTQKTSKDKIVLPANVHNTRRHQMVHVSDNEIR